jgi:ribosomal protein S12 methylthiotransferase accessory factor
LSQRGTFTVYLTDDYLRDEFIEFNRSAVENRSEWMMVQPVGTILWFGPIFLSPQTPCWNCLALRLREKRRVEAFLRTQPNSNGAVPPIATTFQPASDAALHLAAIQVLKQITAPQTSSRPSHLFTLDTREMKLEKHAVMRRNDCRVCGNPEPVFPEPIILKERKRNAPSPAQIFHKYEHHISFRTGIVDEMNLFQANGIVNSMVADHLFVLNVERNNLLRKGLTQKSWGKGLTEDQAKTGALCESLERYSGLFRGSEFRTAKTVDEIGELAIPLESCLNFSEEQYRNRETLNRSNSEKDWIPVPLDRKRKIEWSPVYSLTRRMFRYLPTAYCYYGYPLPQGDRFCRADSNGNAAGTTLEEAIFHGFLEIVERDCAAIWWFNRLKRPALDLESCSLPFLQELQLVYKKYKRKFWVLDITSDFQIPCFAALSMKTAGKPDYLLGLGSHFDPVAAITRAIAEMNQFLPVRLHQRKFQMKKINEQKRNYLHPNGKLTFVDYIHNRNLLKAGDSRVRTCVQLAQDRGMETFVLNQTRADVGIFVAKVIVPGMRQFRVRFAPGRLYDVPVQMGWLKKAHRENQLNPDRYLV